MAIGAEIVAAGLYQFYKAYETDFREGLKRGEMSTRARTWVTRAGCLGYSARGMIFTIIGVFLAQVALTPDPQKARGIGGTLAPLAEQSSGPYLLFATLGLVAYGVYRTFVNSYASSYRVGANG